MKEVNVLGIMMDPTNGTPVVVLREGEGGRMLPIWIGPMEALAIQSGLENQTPPRPMTHDLLCEAVRRLGATVMSVEITDIKENTFYARVQMDRGGEKIWIDSRPSDAIAMAVRFGARIYADESVFEKARKPGSKDEADKWTEVLENLDPQAFGKYKV
jgi:bifunctional DNase/RNase